MDKSTELQNIHSIEKSPKFIRRSISPIEYINSNQFKIREKKRDIHVDFGFITEKKLGKVSIKKRQIIQGKNNLKEKNQQIHADKQLPSTFLDNSLFRTSHDISTSNFQRSSEQIGGDQTSYTDILKSLDEDTQTIKRQLDLHHELQNARKKIFQLEQELDSKNRIIQDQKDQIKVLENRCHESLGKAQKYKIEIEKTKIKMSMEMKKNSEFMNQIRNLKADNIRKKNILQRLTSRDKNSYQNRYSEHVLDFFQLSPEKSQE